MLTMRSMMCFALLAASSLTSVVAAPQYREELKHRRACGTHISAARKASSEKRFQSHRMPAAHPDAKATLDLYFHVVYANETTEGGYLTDEQLENQVKVLNEDWTKTGVSFNLVNVSRIENADWFAKVAPESPEEIEMKQTYRYGNASALNVWTVGFMEGEGAGLLGYATFPSDYESAPESDGVVALYSTLPGGLKPPYNKGRTLTHEAGHWGGLYHTFEGGCSGKGDFVEDTPAEREAAYGCPAATSSCPGGKQDPIRNFMNYVNDECMDEWSAGQVTRLRTQLRSFRGVDV